MDTPDFILHSRGDFRQKVFGRDGNLCVVCKAPAQDAHHILERRLWTNGGYYLENGVSLCGKHHLEAESTILSCDKLRELAGISKYPLPEHLYTDSKYDKWGNIILPNGNRLKGELFFDDSVQKILSPVLSLFVNRIKYPRTYHLPWSPGATKDDRIMSDLSAFDDKDIVVTVKMDGENTTMYHDYLHARSIEYDSHPSRSMIKAIHANMAHDIPEGWRVCGENLYAKHSIKYRNLESYFLVFSIWNEQNICLSWKDTEFWTELLGLNLVPTLYIGKWNEELIKKAYQKEYKGNECEGYVVRIANEFPYCGFRKNIAKYVRAQHVQTHGHWMRTKVEANELAKG